jgi:hypothetical protein
VAISTAKVATAGLRRRAGLGWRDVPSELADHAEELGYGVAAI